MSNRRQSYLIAGQHVHLFESMNEGGNRIQFYPLFELTQIQDSLPQFDIAEIVDI